MKHNTIITLLLFVLFTGSLFAQEVVADSTEIRQIMERGRQFSAFYMAGDYTSMSEVYTVDGKIMPPGAEIIEGREAICKRWILPEGVRVVHHQSNPSEITVIGNTAYDAGYYEGTTRRKDGSEVSWKGKYLIIWKKVNGTWQMYYDIWNRID